MGSRRCYECGKDPSSIVPRLMICGHISYFYRKIGEVLFFSFLFDRIVERFDQNDLINRQPSCGHR